MVMVCKRYEEDKATAKLVIDAAHAEDIVRDEMA